MRVQMGLHVVTVTTVTLVASLLSCAGDEAAIFCSSSGCLAPSAMCGEQLSHCYLISGDVDSLQCTYGSTWSALSCTAFLFHRKGQVLAGGPQSSASVEVDLEEVELCDGGGDELPDELCGELRGECALTGPPEGDSHVNLCCFYGHEFGEPCTCKACMMFGGPDAHDKAATTLVALQPQDS